MSEVNEKNSAAFGQAIKDLQSQVSGLEEKVAKLTGLLQTALNDNQQLRSQLLSMQVSKMGTGPTA